MVIVTLIIAGVMVGLISSFFGIGGGVLIVPVLYSIFPSIDPQTVVGSSLMLICFNSMLNCYNFCRIDQRPPLNIVGIIAPTMVLGIILSSFLISAIRPETVKLIFAASLVIAVLKNIFYRPRQDISEKIVLTKKLIFLGAFSGVLAGIVSGLTGLGGGILLVPLMMSLLHLPVKLLSPASNAVMTIGTGFGAISFMLKTKPDLSIFENYFQLAQVGHVNFAIVFCLLAGSLISSKSGTKINQKIKASHSKLAFNILLILMSIRIFLQVLS